MSLVHSPPPARKGPPSAKLGALTKKKQQIEELLPNAIENLEIIKQYFNEYLVLLENLMTACDPCHEAWFKTHQAPIDNFSLRIENIIHQNC